MHERQRVDPPHLSRRRVVAGSAWGVASIVLTTAVPARATSGPTVAFAAPAYAGPRCGTISGVRVLVQGSVSTAGSAVVIQLNNGYTFSGGETSTTVVVGTDGSADVPAVVVPSTAQEELILAMMSGADTAWATLRPAADPAWLSSPSGIVTSATISGAPVPVAGDLFLVDGALHRSGVGLVRSGVAVVGQLAPSPSGQGDLLLPLRLTDGSAWVYSSATGVCARAVGVPSGAAPVAADLFLAQRSLYRDGQVVATSVWNCGTLVGVEDALGTRRLTLPYRTLSGQAALLRPSEMTSRIVAAGSLPPSWSMPLGGDLFLSGSDLYRAAWDDVGALASGVVAQGVDVCGVLTPNPYYDGELLLPFRSTDGRAMLFMYSGDATRAATAVPDGAAPLGADLFRSGAQIFQADSGLRVTGVDRVGQVSPAASDGNAVTLAFTKAGSAC